VPVVAVTRLQLKGIFKLLPFLFHLVPSYFQALKAPGNIKVEVIKKKGVHVWIMSAWEDRAAMEAFVQEQPHRDAMADIGRVCRDAAMAHWEMETLDGFTWEVAEKYLEADGRRPRIIL